MERPGRPGIAEATRHARVASFGGTRRTGAERTEPTSRREAADPVPGGRAVTGGGIRRASRAAAGPSLAQRTCEPVIETAVAGRQATTFIEDQRRLAVVVRVRPLLMTALTAFLGQAPLLFATGSGADIQRPLAVVVMGGLITSTLLTLVVLPVIYGWLEGRRARGAA